MTWIRDEDLMRGKIPMTKFAVRAVTMAVLDITPGTVLVDIGAGTGSISIQAALLGAEVYAVEQAAEGAALIQQNADKLGVNVRVIQASAPACLDRVPAFGACFIGGSGGQLEAIVAAAHSALSSGGRLAANFIKLDNMTIFTRLLSHYGYAQIESRFIHTAELDRHGMLRGQNPVCLVGGRKP